MMMDRHFNPSLFFDLLAADPFHSTDVFSDDEEDHFSPKRMPSPIDFDFCVPAKPFELKVPEFELDEDSNTILKNNDDSGISHESEILNESNDEMVIPNFDFDFSLDELDISSANCDDSFIKQW